MLIYAFIFTQTAALIGTAYIIVSSHHIPIDANAGIYASALKNADHKARRQEISEWFVKNKESLTIGDLRRAVDESPARQGADKMKQGNGKTDNKTSGKANKITFNAETGEIIDEENNENEQEEQNNEHKQDEQDNQDGQDRQYEPDKQEEQNNEYNQTGQGNQNNPYSQDEKESANDIKEIFGEPELEGEASKTPEIIKQERFGERQTPIPKAKQGGAAGFEITKFDLHNYENALLGRIAALNVRIDRKKNSIPSLTEVDIHAFPLMDRYLVSYAALLPIFMIVFSQNTLDQKQILNMIHYAIDEWRKKEIIVDIGDRFFVRKYEFNYDGRTCQAALIPFSMEKLRINGGEKIIEAKNNPFYGGISNFMFARTRME